MTPECPILIVEDNSRERELIASAITSYDLSRNVLTIGSGAEAIDYFARRGPYADRLSLPCLVILDLDLKDMHGLEVLRNIRQNQETRHVPVVIFSGSESALDAAVARELQADGFIVKPTDFHDMRATVRSLAVFWASQVRVNSPMGSSNND